MKRKDLVILLFAFISVFGSWSCMDYQTQKQNPDLDAFSIYLLDDSALTLRHLEYPDVNELDLQLQEIELQLQPLITTDDIMSYDWKSHTFALTETAAAELPSPGVHGIPFVVVSRGQRQYLGFFWTVFSSMGSPYPMIQVDRYADGCSYTIEAGLPNPKHAGEVDPRQSQEIKEALQAAGILIN